MLDDVIIEFAESLVPEAFVRPHSAYRVEIVEDQRAGRAAFDRRVDDRIHEAATTRYAWGSRPDLYVIVEGDDGTRWRWDDSCCCEPE